MGEDLRDFLRTGKRVVGEQVFVDALSRRSVHTDEGTERLANGERHNELEPALTIRLDFLRPSLQRLRADLTGRAQTIQFAEPSLVITVELIARPERRGTGSLVEVRRLIEHRAVVVSHE